MVNEIKEKEEIIIAELSQKEQKALRFLILGYGKLKKASDKSGIKTRTLDRIALTGKGLQKNIDAIREKLLFVEQDNAAN